MGLTSEVLLAGDDLNDDMWHSVKVSRRGMTISLKLDEDKAISGEK